MRIVLKFSNNIYNTINNPEINVIYFFNNKRFYFHEFKMGDSYEYRRYAMLNYNIYIKRLKYTKEYFITKVLLLQTEFEFLKKVGLL